jgi:hypothetical protein
MSDFHDLIYFASRSGVAMQWRGEEGGPAHSSVAYIIALRHTFRHQASLIACSPRSSQVRASYVGSISEIFKSCNEVSQIALVDLCLP